MKLQPAIIPGNGITLEGCLFVPEASPLGGVAVCHPHPLYGGSMDNSIVQPIALACARQGMLALAFNFRGVGDSGGSHDGGNFEQDDLKAALEHLGSQPGMEGKPLGVTGYSFGGMVALKLALRSRSMAALALVSPASPWSDLALLPGFESPWLYISGGLDPHVPDRYARQLREKTGKLGAVVIEASADHLWCGSEDALAHRVAVFMRKHLNGVAGSPGD